MNLSCFRMGTRCILLSSIGHYEVENINCLGKANRQMKPSRLIRWVFNFLPFETHFILKLKHMWTGPYSFFSFFFILGTFTFILYYFKGEQLLHRPYFWHKILETDICLFSDYQSIIKSTNSKMFIIKSLGMKLFIG